MAGHHWSILLILITACSWVERGAEKEARDSGTLIVGRSADAISLDPARVTDNESVEVCSQIYESLLRYKEGSQEVEASLAESWTVSEDGKVWDFTLREGVRFHDGTSMNAKAVVFSLQRQLDPKHPYFSDDDTGLDFAWRKTFQNIQTLEVVSEYEVRITIERRYTPFAANLAMFPVSIVSPRAVRKWGARFYLHPVGTGPFSFVEWKGGRVVLKRNAEYWGAKAKLKYLVFRVISDARQRLIALESRSIDVAYSVLPEEINFVALHPQFNLYFAPENNVTYLALNTQKLPFKDVQIRRALNHAIDKKRIVNWAYQGMATLAQGALPPSHWGHVPKSFAYEYEPDKAMALLNEAMVERLFDPSEPLRLYYPYTPRPYLPNPHMVAQMIASDLESVGLKVELIAQEFPAFFASIRQGEHDMSLMGWIGDNGDPDNYLHVLFSSDNQPEGVGGNLAFFEDPKVNELLRQGQGLSRSQDRYQRYKEAQMRIGQLAPWVPLVHSQIFVVAHAEVKGIALDFSTHIQFSKVVKK